MKTTGSISIKMHAVSVKDLDTRKSPKGGGYYDNNGVYVKGPGRPGFIGGRSGR